MKSSTSANFLVPSPLPGEVLLRVRAVALNGFDPMMLQGSTGIRVPFPMVPCGDAAGEVAGFGPGTDPGPWRVGDRAALDPVIENRGMMGEKVLGVAREYVAVPLKNLVPVPDGVSLEAAAAVPVAYGTAQRVVEERARIEPGETVLVLGATGGVGVCCVQLCKLAGATVIATGSGEWKREKLKELGADHVFPSRTEEWLGQVKAIAGRPRYLDKAAGGVDAVVNYIGGDTWAASLKILRYHGRMITCGATAGYDPPTDIRYNLELRADDHGLRRMEPRRHCAAAGDGGRGPARSRGPRGAPAGRSGRSDGRTRRQTGVREVDPDL